MALEKIAKIEGRGVWVPGDDVDTDRIIPARFMKCVTFDGLGRYAFFDARFEEDGVTAKQHPLNDERFRGASILFVGRNFGCGSSREHAPQSLHKFGIRAIVAESFAEIFYGNCITLGIPCVSLPKAQIEKIGGLLEADPRVAIVLDLEARKLRVGAERFAVEIKESTREALVSGQWDPIGALLEGAVPAKALCERLPYTRWKRAG